MKVTFGGKKKKVAAMPPQTLINYFSSAPSPRSAPVHGSNERGEGSVVSQTLGGRNRASAHASKRVSVRSRVV